VGADEGVQWACAAPYHWRRDNPGSCARREPAFLLAMLADFTALLGALWLVRREQTPLS
jgi:hypothetical protein